MEQRIDLLLGLLAAIAALALLARKSNIPYPVLFVIGGLVLALVPGLPRLRLQPELFFFLFLPPLIFPAALATSWRDFHAEIRPILLLAIGLVLFTTIVVGYLAHHLVPTLPLAAAFALGAIVSPPDAVASAAVTQRLGVPRRIVTIVDGESLVNDASALVALEFAVAALESGTFSPHAALLRFVFVVLGGLALGLGVGWVSVQVQKAIDDPPVQTIISLLTPFAAYLPAERLAVSGILGVVAAGIYIGWRSPEIADAKTRLQETPFWEMIVYLLNGAVFILIGLQLPEVLHGIKGESKALLCAQAFVISMAVILVRIIWVFAGTYLPRWLNPGLRQREPVPGWRNVFIVAWTGMRGGVSLAAALALPLTGEASQPFPGRDLVLFFTFSVILATLVVQGLSLPFIIRWLEVRPGGEAEREEQQARLEANRAAMNRLEQLAREDSVPPMLVERLRLEYEERIKELLEWHLETEDDLARGLASPYQHLQFEALKVEREAVLGLRNQRVINDEVMRRIERDLDLAEARLHLK